MKFKRIAIVKLKGGFGNQLFQIMFINHLKTKGIKVLVDTSFFSIKDYKLEQNNLTKRELVLPLDTFGLKSVSRVLIYLINISFQILKKFNFKIKNKIIANIFYGHDYDPKRLGYLNIFDGYWKDPNILKKNINYLFNSFYSIDSFKKNIIKKPEKNTLLVHVRRTDFVDNGWALSEKFYIDSIRTIFSKKGDQKIDIFTDDAEWVKNSYIYEKFDIRNIYSENKNENPFSSFLKMLNYENFIIGNSTFAFFPAYLKAKETSIVIVPDPWFKNGDHPSISKNNWLKIKNT